MTTIYRRDQTKLEHEGIRRRQALDYAVDELRRAANALNAARVGDQGSVRDTVIEDARRRLDSMQRELRMLE